MHADIEELLNLRDGGPIGSDRAAHVAGCEQCRRELALLEARAAELRRLPQFVPPKHLWPAIRLRLAHDHVRRSWTRNRIGSAAAAAVVIVSLGAFWALRPAHIGRRTDADTALSAAESNRPLVQRSQQLEGVLQNLPQRPAVERAATSAAIDDLQAQIEMLDLQIADTPHGDVDKAHRLWDTRVQLLTSLVQVRYAEALRNGYTALN
jgi:hypothetical protein